MQIRINEESTTVDNVLLSISLLNFVADMYALQRRASAPIRCRVSLHQSILSQDKPRTIAPLGLAKAASV